MLFIDAEYAVLLGLVLLLYWWRKGLTQRKVILLVASYVFYDWFDWRLGGLLFLSSIIDYLAALAIERAAPGSARRRLLLLVSIGSNLTILGTFKYFDFFSSSFAAALGRLGLEVDPVLLQVILPPGLSFYTFQSMSYAIDVYDGRIPARRSLLDVLLFVAFFPQLVAGPIVRAGEFLPQLDRRMTARDVPLAACALLFLVGLFKKAVVADSIGWAIDPIWADPAAYDRNALWAAMALFRIQLYCDFSGYSEMAIASAGLLGFRLPWNFDAPLLATSLPDYWQRWHMTLSTWFRDYVYRRLPFRKKGWSIYRNILITMVLVGLWHGAGWTFAVWGLLQAIGLCFVLALRRNGIHLGLPAVIGLLLTFAFGMVTNVFFRASSLATVDTVLSNGIGLGEDGQKSLGDGWEAWAAFALLAAVHIAWRRWALGHRLLRLTFWVQALLYGVAGAVTLSLMPFLGQPFFYFQF